MRAAQWRLLGLGLGVALGTAALLADAGAIERLVAAVGLDRLTPYAQPPLGHTARDVLALALIVLGVALGWGLGLIFGAQVDREVPDAAEPEIQELDLADRRHETLHIPSFAPSAQGASMNALGWRTPTGVAAAPDAAAIGLAESQEVVPSPAIGPHDVVPEMVRAEPLEETVLVPVQGAARGTSEHVASVQHTTDATPRPEEHAMPELSPALARIEAIVADIARHGPQGFGSRFEAIDARLQQMAQQMAELAALARAQQRTPVTLPTRDARPPADPAQRRALAQTARDLRARLGEPELA